MIAKCALIALLAVVATAAPQCDQSLLLARSGCSSQSSSPVVVVPSGSGSSSGSCSSSSGSSSSGAITRNYVAKGKYPVALRNCGPTPDQQIPVTTSRVTAPAQEKPLVRLPATIPAPRVIAHSCTCYKTVIRPRVHQQIISVPTLERYLETTHKPVIENIQYEAIPVNCESGSSSSALQFVEVGSGSSSSGSSSGSSCGSETIQIPAQTQQASQVQLVALPQQQAQRVQVVEAPQVETIQIPQFQVPQCQKCQQCQ